MLTFELTPNDPNALVGADLAAALSTPIRFTSSLGVSYIGVKYPGVPEQLIFARIGDAPGVFLDEFAATSTVAGSSYEVLPVGGWPVVPRLRVEEVVSAGGGLSGGQSWASIYSIDLTAQPTVTMLNPGTYAVDGYDWFVKGSSVVGGGYSAVLATGSGLLAPSAAFSPSGDYIYKSLWFPFGPIAAFNPDAPYAVAMRFDGTGLSDATRFIVAGLASLVNDSAYIPAADRDAQNLIRYDGGSNVYHLVGQSVLNVAATDLTGALGTHAFYATQLAQLVASSGRRAYATPPLNPDVHTLALALDPVANTAAPTNPGFWFTSHSNPDVFLTHLSVLQPSPA